MVSHLVRLLRLLPEGWIIERLDTLYRSLQRRYLSLCERLCEPPLGVLQLERRGNERLSDRRKANTRVVVRVTIGHGDVEAKSGRWYLVDINAQLTGAAFFAASSLSCLLRAGSL